MVREYKLTWKPSEQRWRKMYKGKWLTFSGEGGKKASYGNAWQEFLKAKARIDSEAAQVRKNSEVVDYIEQLQKRLLEEHHDSETTRDHWNALESLKAELGKENGNEAEQLYCIAQERAKGLQIAYLQTPKAIRSKGVEIRSTATQTLSNAPPWEESAATVQALVDGFQSDRRRQIELGKLSMARFDNQRRYLKRLVDHLGGSSPLIRLDSSGLASFRDRILDDLAIGTLSPSSARDQLQAAKHLCQWAFDRGILEELPRCLARGYSVSVIAKEPEAMTKAEIEALFKASNDRQRLYLLLGLNCAMTSADLSALERQEIDLRKGVITRKRSKTKRAEGAPVVTYRLWEETLGLLRQEIAKSGPVALLTINGKPLVQQSWRADGSLKKNDTVHSAWVRLQEASKVSKPHKLLRKTGATLLNQSVEFARFVPLYLGHSPNGIAEKHYAQADKAGFDEALKWLRSQFKFATGTTATK